MRKHLFNLIRVGFFILMAGVLLLVLLSRGVPYACKKTFLLSNTVIAFLLISALGIFSLVLCWWKCRKSSVRKPDASNQVYDKIVKYLTLCLLIVEVYISYNIFCVCTWDPTTIWYAALARCYRDSDAIQAHAWYFSRYPNNLLLLLLESTCLTLNDNWGIFAGNYNMMSAIIVDCMAISCSCFLVYRVLSLYVDRKFAFGGFVAAVVLCGLSPWMSICYSDSLGIIFPILSFYLYVKPTKSVRFKWIDQILAVCVSCIGYFIKPQCIIILIAIILVDIFNFSKAHKLEQLVKPIAFVAIAFICLAVTSGLLKAQYESLDVKLDPEQEIGMSHFLMMGMNYSYGGVYSQEDVDYSVSFASCQERTAANIEKCIERLHELGITGYTRLLAAKLLTAFHDGTFAWGMEGNGINIQVVDNLNTYAAPFLKSIFYSAGDLHEYLKLLEQIAWIAVLLFSCSFGLVKQAEEKKRDLSILMMSIIGLTLFEMLFEVRARYIFIYVPIFCILAALGFENLYTNGQMQLSKRASRIYSKDLKKNC